MLTFEKVLEVFGDYLQQDPLYEVITTSHGYTLMAWEPKRNDWYKARYMETPEILMDSLLDTYASGTVLAKNIFSVYCLQAFRLHKIERPSNSPIPGQAVKPPAPLFLQGQVSLSRLSFSPPLFPAPDRFAGTRQRQH